MRYYEIFGEGGGDYYIYLYINSLDDAPVSICIEKRKFREWAEGKFEKRPYAGKKKIQEKKKSVSTNLVTTDEKEIMKQVLDMMQGKDYILETDAIEGIKHYSKAKTRRTIKKDYVLTRVGLKRIRATKKIKLKYGITSGGYPIIICKEN